MPSEACPICGDEVDSDDNDGHGHFDSEDGPEDDVEVVHYLISGVRKDKLACGGDADSEPASSGWDDVNCSRCLAKR